RLGDDRGAGGDADHAGVLPGDAAEPAAARLPAGHAAAAGANRAGGAALAVPDAHGPQGSVAAPRRGAWRRCESGEDMAEDIRLAAAPVSWGVTEVAAGAARLPWTTVMDEIAAAGYEATELGPYGYYPTDPAELRAALAVRGLTLTSAFVP